MSNALTNMPIRIDTDITTWRNASAVVATGVTTGIRPTKIVLEVGAGGASSAGQVTITAPSDSATLYPPQSVSASVPAYTILYSEDVTSPVNMTWRDFAVTGVTATGTVLFIWFRYA